MTATMLGYHGSKNFRTLNQQEIVDGEIEMKYINREAFFFLGISMGGIMSVIFYVTVF